MTRFLRRTSLTLALLLVPLSAALAMSTNVTITVISSAATAVSCIVSSPSGYVSPVAAGTKVCPINVTPAGWTGTVALSGTDAASFTTVADANASAGVDLAFGPAYTLPSGSGAATLNVTITLNP